MSEQIKLGDIQVLSKRKYLLQNVSYDIKKRSGEWDRLQREVYDHGDAATVLLYNKEKKTIILVKQFRIAVFLDKDPSGMLLETCAGLLDGEDPQTAIIREIEEETGYQLSEVQKVYEAYTSAGSLKEKLYFFIGEYKDEHRKSKGGGLEEEHEELDVIEMPFDEAIAMLDSGKIVDAKTIILLQYALIKKIFH
jgi:GDP-mannose pyrophosphatase NudK